MKVKVEMKFLREVEMRGRGLEVESEMELLDLVVVEEIDFCPQKRKLSKLSRQNKNQNLIQGSLLDCCCGEGEDENHLFERGESWS